MGRQRRYYDPGKNPQPSRPLEGGVALQAHTTKDTRQLRRAREREAAKTARRKTLPTSSQ